MIRYPVSCRDHVEQLMGDQFMELGIVRIQVRLHCPLVMFGVIISTPFRIMSKSPSLSESQPANTASQNMSSRWGRCVLLLRKEQDGVKAITAQRPPSCLDLMDTSFPLMSSVIDVGLSVCIMFVCFIVDIYWLCFRSADCAFRIIWCCHGFWLFRITSRSRSALRRCKIPARHRFLRHPRSHRLRRVGGWRERQARRRDTI